MNTLMRQKISELLTIMLEPKPSGWWLEPT
jgi:hypothetical protein